jgi:hypothetical protein
MGIHPATWLLTWGGLVVLTQSVSLAALAGTALVVIPASLIWSGARVRRLLLRTRWLFLSIAVLFLFAVPGERLPGPAGDLGMSLDGIALAAEHLLRLLLLLASLALLHERLGTGGMMTGIHWLLTPLARWRALRERIVVRLMLVLDYVETTPGRGWRAWLAPESSGPERLSLEARAIGRPDWLALALLAMLMIAVWRWS